MSSFPKNPPFGAPLSHLIKQGYRPSNSIYLFTGLKAWDRGYVSTKARPTRTLILPAYEAPQLYSWPVTDCDILIIDTGYCDQEYIEDLAACLYHYRADVVRYLSPENLLTIYQKDL